MNATLTKTEAARAAAEQAIAGQTSVCLTCSFQAEDMVALHLVREQIPSVPVLFLETGYHFSEVYAYRDAMTSRYGLNLINVLPEHTVAEQESQFGILYQTQPDQCCKLRKVGPLFQALRPYDVWFTGLRRVQSPTRANLQVFDTFPLPTGKKLSKVSLLADWTDKDVWDFAKENDIPLLPLYQAGYTSIGCAPCTRAIEPGADQRAGRWWWENPDSRECGLHPRRRPAAVG